MYAVAAEPIRHPNVAIIMLSTKPRSNSNGPSMPVTRLLAVMLALYQRRQT